MMKVTFVSNFLNHHQIPLCEELARKSDFSFIACEDMPENLKAFRGNAENAPYLFSYCGNVDRLPQVETMLRESDVVIFGSCPHSLIVLRAETGKLRSGRAHV